LIGRARRVLGIGQPAGGDDAVGILVARWLQDRVATDDVSIQEVSDPLQLIEGLAGIDQAVLVDAVVAEDEPGRIMQLQWDEIENHRTSSLSSHGIGVGTVVLLARRLNSPLPRDISVVGIVIKPPAVPTYEISEAVAAAIPKAGALVREILDA